VRHEVGDGLAVRDAPAHRSAGVNGDRTNGLGHRAGRRVGHRPAHAEALTEDPRLVDAELVLQLREQLLGELDVGSAPVAGQRRLK